MMKSKKIEKIEKIKDKVEIMDVKGQGCKNDCVEYMANQSSSSGCGPKLTCKMTCAF